MFAVFEIFLSLHDIRLSADRGPVGHVAQRSRADGHVGDGVEHARGGDLTQRKNTTTMTPNVAGPTARRTK